MKKINYTESIAGILLKALPLVLMLGFITACEVNKDWDNYYHGSAGREGKNVLDLLAENPDYSMFLEKVKATGYDTVLKNNQYFTLFVPTNEAFTNLPSYSDAEWKKIIAFHICYTNLFSASFTDADIKTLLGKYLRLRETTSGGFTISGANINLNTTDINCGNGVIHEIDKVLIPKQNIYEYIMSLGDDYSLLKRYISSMDSVYIDLDKSTRIGVDDNGNTVYDTVWARTNTFLDNVALIEHEDKPYTLFLINDNLIMQTFQNASDYFGDVTSLSKDVFNQLLSIPFDAAFCSGEYKVNELPDTIVSVTGDGLPLDNLSFSEQTDLQMSNGVVHILNGFNIPKEFFLAPIVIECDNKTGRKVSNTVYDVEIRSDSRATNGTYFFYGSKFIGDYAEFTVNMVLATKYWIIWTGPALGGSLYQLSVDGVNLGDPVDNYYKGNFKPVVAGSVVFDKFGTRTIRMTIAGESIPGYNSIYLDYIKLVPDELYNP